MAGKKASAQIDDGNDLFDNAGGRAGGGGGGSSDGQGVPPPGGEENAPLLDIAQARYLNYALSVITSRALPDVRDGM
jgi:DNA gyrase subunit A